MTLQCTCSSNKLHPHNYAHNSYVYYINFMALYKLRIIQLANPHHKPEMHAQATLVTRDEPKEQLAEVVAPKKPKSNPTPKRQLSKVLILDPSAFLPFYLAIVFISEVQLGMTLHCYNWYSLGTMSSYNYQSKQMLNRETHSSIATCTSKRPVRRRSPVTPVFLSATSRLSCSYPAQQQAGYLPQQQTCRLSSTATAIMHHAVPHS